MQIFLKEHPEFIANRNILEQKTEQSKIVSKTNITIPIVVHVIYANSSQNISDAQILSQIDVLNKDFRRTNSDVFNTPTDFSSIVSDMQIMLDN